MKLRRPLIALASLALAVASVEIVVRAYVLEDGRYRRSRLAPFGELDPEYRTRLSEALQSKREGRRKYFFRTFDAELGWTNLPGVRDDGREVAINSIGARGTREYAPVPAAGVQRVVAYGDSFVWGSEVGTAECWPAQLEAKAPTIEAINLGVPAYGTDQALLRFRRKGRLGAQIVLIGIMLENVCRNVNRYRPMYATREWFPLVKPRFVLEDGDLVLVPVPFASEIELLESTLAGGAKERTREFEFWAGDEPWFPPSALSRLITTRVAFERRRYDSYYRAGPNEPLEVTLAILERFYQEALEAGAERAVVLVFGKGEDVVTLDYGPPYWNGFLRELEDRGVPALDLASELHPWMHTEALFTRAHLSPAGNRLVAERIQRWLTE